MRDAGNVAAFMAYQTDKSKQPAFQAEYQNSPAMLAHKKQMSGVKGVADGAKAVYEKGGDQALADYYLNADPQYSTRGQTNPAKLVKAGKTTFADVAKEEQQQMKEAAGQYANSPVKPDLLYKNGEFNFALGGSGGNSNNNQSGGTVSTQPVSNPSDGGSSTQPKYSWQKAKEKSQAWQTENDKVNEWKNSSNTNSGLSSFNKQYDFSGKSFTGS